MKCVIAILLTAAGGFAASLDFSSGQAARLVIGQPQFDAQSGSASSTILGAVGGLAYANNTLFVADSNLVGAAPINNRVLIYQSLSGQLPAATAELEYNQICPACVGQANVVLGQPNFTSTTPVPCIAPSDTSTSSTSSPTCPTNPPLTPTATGMRTPTGVASDGVHLAVADTQNNRVLVWNSIPTSMNQPPDVVVGQTDFTSSNFPGNTPTATSLRSPQGVWLQDGKLFVADTQNDRVLIYNHIPTSNGAAADVVLGQPDFTTFVQVDITQQKTNAAANNLLTPVSVTSDGQHLFVADLGYNRVLIWNSIPTSNQAPADVVVGQPDMVSSLPNNAYTTNSTGVQSPVLCTTSNGKDSNNNPTYPGVCAATLSFPRFALSDGTRLFIADGGNDRVLVYNSIPLSNGKSADYVLGQANENVDYPSLSADTMNTPLSLAWDGTNLFVADAYNQRVLVFTIAEQNIGFTAVRNAASLNIYAVGSVVFSGTVNSGDKVTVTIQGKNYAYTIQKGDDFTAVVNGLVALINAGGGDPNALATSDAPADTLVLTARSPNAAGDNVTLATSVSTNAQIVATASGANLAGGGDAASIAPGTLVSILGNHLSDVSMPAPPGTHLPTNLGGVEVYFDGVRAPVMYVSPNQINSQVPFSFTDTGAINVWVRTQHADGSVSASNAEAVTLVPANPGIFVQSSGLTDPRPAVAVHASSYATGLISVDGTVNAGDVATVVINGRTYNYTVQASDTLASIAGAIVALLGTDPQVEAHTTSAFTRVVLQAKVSGTAGDGIPFSATVSTGAKLILTAEGPAAPAGTTGVILCCASNGGGLITQSSPAVPGETIIVYATGLGLPVLTSNVAPYVLTGQVYQGSADNTPINSLNSLAGGKTANVLSAALAPGMPSGLYQVYLQLNTSLTTDPQTQLTIAQNTFVSNIVTFPVSASVIPNTLTCTPLSLNSGGTSSCTVTLNVVAPTGGSVVALSSSNSGALSVPASVSIAAGATTATFTATAGTISSSQTATITATLNGSLATATISLAP
jgi:uncharacterized protein (TIGR03437 family)